jgi:hypothetical protein
MSLVRVGTNSRYADGWGLAFSKVSGGRKSAAAKPTKKSNKAVKKSAKKGVRKPVKKVSKRP